MELRDDCDREQIEKLAVSNRKLVWECERRDAEIKRLKRQVDELVSTLVAP